MAEQTFRSSLSQFRWARGTTDDSQPASQQQAAGGNSFSRFYNSMSSYVPLRSDERSNEDEAYLALSRWERLLGFVGCLLGAAVCFFIAFLVLPLIPIKPRKFAVAFSLGSLLVMMGFAVLSGPMNHLRHLTARERLPFSTAYVGSLVLTIYFSVVRKSYLGALIAAVVQVVALVSYVLAYFPGGTQTIRFGGQMMLRGAGNVLPF